MKNLVIDNHEYKLIEDYKNGFDLDVVSSKLTDYFYYFDYIVGDWSYGKLRLKGFCKKENINYRDLNDFNKKEQYINNNCAYDCKYFVLENMNVLNEQFKKD